MNYSPKEYLAEVCKAIDELAMLRPTAERIECMHDYLYVKKHYAEYAGHKEMHHDKEDMPKSYFGG